MRNAKVNRSAVLLILAAAETCKSGIKPNKKNSPVIGLISSASERSNVIVLIVVSTRSP